MSSGVSWVSHKPSDRKEPYSAEEFRNIEEIFEQLIPPHTLEHLGITDLFASSYPTWLGTTHLSSLKYLIIRHCQSCEHLPAIGNLQNLKRLEIHGATAVTKIGPEFVGCGAIAFPRLEVLVIRGLTNWEDWTFAVFEENAETGRRKEVGEDVVTVKQEGEAPTPRMQFLPRLKHLVLDCCPRLRALPPQLGQGTSSLKTLELRHMHCLKVVENFMFLSESLLIAQCESLERVSNIPNVRFLNAPLCLKLRCVETLDNLQKLIYTDDMLEMSSLWLPGLIEQRRKLQGEDLDVYTWPGCSCYTS
ncbi:hypothetical protein HU200_038497 [Digitaria exilis]|uniref:R13L1/DRL21-like LRR repeat region domain-containing protein n=1 Tax=Digitaria exilis TaxID=1010633 RepID=A0A835BA00_9POAL|nr:hypothetical protein HU200_038497 [Digitaria exilis]